MQIFSVSVILMKNINLSSIPSVPKKAEQHIFSTLRAKSVKHNNHNYQYDKDKNQDIDDTVNLSISWKSRQFLKYYIQVGGGEKIFSFVQICLFFNKMHGLILWTHKLNICRT